MTKLKVPAKLENLEPMIGFIREGIEGLGFSKKENNQIHLVCEEILLNIIDYAYPGKSGEIEIKYKVDPSKKDVELEFSDLGIPFNPLSAPEPDVDAPVEDREIGGLGIFLVRKIMDEVIYKRDGNSNILRLIKRYGSNPDPTQPKK
ncbi:MAG: ATP-binding protein [bacterium]|nr:ATP-binding protein [bacterium]